MRIHNRRDFNAGLMFLAIGGGFAVLAQDYSMGTPTRMGPGYFPFLLAAIMLFLGAVVLVMSFVPADAEEPPGATDWRGIGLVLASVLLFALLLPIAGFLLAVLALVFVSALASHEFRWKETLGLAIALIALGVGVFGYGLELQFSVLPPALVH